MRPRYFERLPGSGQFLPLGEVESGWASDRVPGPAVTGLLTLGALEEAALRFPAARLARVSCELHSVVRMLPLEVTHRVVKAGSRLGLLEVVLAQLGAEVARATAAFVAPQAAPPNRLWVPGVDISPPPAGGETDAFGRQYYSESAGWVSRGAEIDPVCRKGVWLEELEFIASEPTPPEVVAGVLADAVNPVASWGTQGIRHINIDASLSLSRAPVPGGVGLIADRVVEGEGVISASAVVFDRAGSLGVAGVTSIAQRTTVDPARWAPA